MHDMNFHTAAASSSGPSAPLSADAGLEWTIVIPAYNEEKRLGATLERILGYLKGRRFEILVVDDGSTDGTVALVEGGFPGVRVLRNPGNRGKGYSVRAGLLAGEGRWILFSDADLSTPIEEIERFEQALRDGADMVIASRALPGSILERRQSWWRERAGRMFNLLVRIFSGLPWHDTQCGFKAYTREAARRIAQFQRLEGWAFDVEQLHLARLLGLQVREIPVRWINSEDSKVHFFRDAFRMFLDTLKVRLTRYDIPPR